jgi:7,8-dihydropterin-6-yl-methyl-4-(beta-D-ribofuranosyl)aminobenzene 5'-phosphate synthase
MRFRTSPERGQGIDLMAKTEMLFQLSRYASALALAATIGGAFVAVNVIGGESTSAQVSHEVSIVTVFDNCTVNPELATRWGLGAVVMTPSANILFDTGSDGRILLSNMSKLGIRPKAIHKVVISHVHLDHLGGLQEFLSVNSDVEVYIPASFPGSVRESITSSGARYRDISGALQIDKGIFTTGQMGTSLIEQSLVVDTSEGLVVITGCAHPGIVDIIKRAKEVVPNRPVALVMGGFHLGSFSDKELRALIQDFRRWGVRKVAPSHCSGERARAYFQSEYMENYVAGGAGNIVTLR